MGRIAIEPIPCLRDNYCYLISTGDDGDAWLVDPSEEGPPARVLAARPGLRLRGILATHHHHDHVGGIEALHGRGDDVWVAGHISDRGRIPAQTLFVDAPRARLTPCGIDVAGVELLAMHIPGHTTGAIAWCIPGHDDTPASVFTGDTLFAAGCGRLFEGTPAQMHGSLQSLVDMPPDTRLWFGHEYTEKNLEFALTVEPNNEAMARRRRALGACTTPTTVAEERDTNPFVRAQSVDELARRREAKDRF